MRDIIILGAGGHAQVVADILSLQAENGNPCQVIGFLDDDQALQGKRFLGIPVLGGVDELPQFSHEGVIVAIGDNRVRARIFSDLIQKGCSLINAVHPDAVIAAGVSLGMGVMICAGVVINTGAVIGDNVIINTGSRIDHHNHIQPHAHIAPGSTLGGDVSVGEGTLVGIGSTVMPQISIGDWSTVGAGAVVTRDIPDRVTALGIPASYRVDR